MELLSRYLPREEFDNYDDFTANFKITVPDDFNYARDIIDAWAEGEPDKTALIYCNDEGFSKAYTFAEISELSKRAATWLTSIGIKKGDRVLTLARRRWEYWIIAVAVYRIGAVLIPVSIQMMEKDLIYRVNTSKAKLILALNDEFVLNQIKNVKANCESLETIATIGDTTAEGYRSFTAEFINCEPAQELSDAKESDEMIIYFTSGTAGYPKMAVHNRKYPLGHIVTAKFMHCVENNGLHLCQVDSGWAKFGWGSIYAQWICGTAILGYDPARFHAGELLDMIEKYKPTTVCLPVTMYRFLLKDGFDGKKVESVKWFTTAGEPLSGASNLEFKDITGQFIHEGFGQSETTPITCTFPWIKVKPSSMGRPSPLYDIAIVDPDGKQCKQGEAGEVVIYVHDRKNQLGLLDYYMNGTKYDPAEDGVYHTGDRAYEDEDGYYWYVGREDDMIKCSGYRIGPFEIESILNTHPAVKEAAIVGAPDPVRGQIVCAVIVLHDGVDPSYELTKELQEYVKDNTAPYKYPRKIVYVPELPKTSSGKIIRREAKNLIR